MDLKISFLDCDCELVKTLEVVLIVWCGLRLYLAIAKYNGNTFL